MKKIILSIVTVGMMAVGGIANAGYMSFMGWMPDGEYTAINDVHDYELEQIELFLGYGPDDPNTGLVFYDKWDRSGGQANMVPGEENLIWVSETTTNGDGEWIGGYWHTIGDATGASVMTVKADSMIGIWAMPEIGALAIDGDWDTYFTMPPGSMWSGGDDGMWLGGGTFTNGAEVSHITWWNEVGDRDRDITPPDSTIAEPASMMLFGLGLTGLGLVLRRREKKIALND